MEFGIFSQMHVPVGEDEHSRFMRSIEVSMAADAYGFKYDWAPEHHFLTNYSHQPASECYLAYVAAKTKQIHVGSAIFNITAPVNHPARVAERVATLDHLTEGRFEFGTGRGSSSAEWGGFAIPSAAETKPMWKESIVQIPRMWRDEEYEFEGKYFRMPKRNVLPKPFSKPNPPMWVACASPNTFGEAGELGLGCLCFTLGTPDEIAGHLKNYKDGIKRCKEPVGGFINDCFAVTTAMYCLPDGDEARQLMSKAKSEDYTALFFKWLDSIPRPDGLPREGDIVLPAPTPADFKARLSVGAAQVGSPEEITPVIQRYADMGVDQIIYSPLTHAMDQKNVLRALECFGNHVLPKFDKTPEHRTTALRKAALKQSKAA